MVLPDHIEEIKTIRRDLHRIPEPGFQEIQTQAYIENYLKEIGLSPIQCAKTGVLCLIDMGEDDTIALRSDMDGLPVSEKTNASYESETPGMMHACGHDGHMAMLLLLAKIIVTNGLKFTHNILLIFQPAEEGPGGAKDMIASEEYQRHHISHVFGYHLTPDYPFGTIAAREGEFFASGVEFFIEIEGKSAHGAQPHLGKDCVMIGSQIVQALHAIPSRNIDPLQDCVLSVGTFHSGDQINVTSGHANLSGIVRSYNQPTKDKLLSRIKMVCDGFAMMHECKIDFIIKEMYPPLCNDEALYARVSNILRDDMQYAAKVMLAEDFSYFTLDKPSMFMFLGTAKENIPTYPLHSSKFDFDEEVLLVGIDHYLTILENI